MGFQEEEDDDVSIYTEEWHDVAGPMQVLYVRLRCTYVLNNL